MERSYKARYYSGKSSRAQTVDVCFKDGNLVITGTDEQGAYLQRAWERAGIRQTEFSSSIITLRYGDGFPYEQLEITDRDFYSEYKAHFRVSRMNRIVHRQTGRSVILLIAGFFGLMCACYAWVLPAVADLIGRQFPKEYEISLGKQIYDSVLEGEEVDSARTAAINRFFAQVDAEKSYPVRITVVRNSVANAFALPGGGIIVHDQILKSMKDYDELAALLAHEYSHVEMRHATRNVFRNLAGYLFISIIFSDVNAIASVVIENAESLRTLSYSRKLEQEADDNGMKILRENKIPVKGMQHLFEHLKKEEHIEMVEFLSSHPDLDSRIESVKAFEKQHPYEPVKNDSMQVYFDRLMGW